MMLTARRLGVFARVGLAPALLLLLLLGPLGNAQERGAAERTPPGRHSAEAQAWGEALKERQPWTVPSPEEVRYGLQAGESHLYFVRAEYAQEPPRPEAEAEPPQLENGDERPEEPERDEAQPETEPGMPDVELAEGPQRRTLCRVPIRADADGDLEEIAELGAYPLGYELLDGGERVVIVHQPRNDDGATTRRTVRLGEPTEEGWQWRDLYTGTPQLVLAGALELHGEVLLVEPGEERFENRILRLSLDEPEAEPFEWTTGLYPSCVDEDERYLIVTRIGESPRAQGFRRGPIERPDEIDEDARLRYPPSVVTVSLTDPEQQRRLVARQDFVHVRFVHEDIAYADIVEQFPRGGRDHPAIQGIHSLAYFDLGDDEAPTRVPMSEESRFDFQLLGPLPDRGILFLRNTNINRHLYLFTGDMRTIHLHELSPLTAEFTLSPDRQTLFFLEYTAEARAPYNPKRSPTRLRALDLRE